MRNPEQREGFERREQFGRRREAPQPGTRCYVNDYFFFVALVQQI